MDFEAILQTFMHAAFPFNKLKPNAVFVCDCCVENLQCEARKKTTYEFLQARLAEVTVRTCVNSTLASSAPPLFEHLFEKNTLW